MRLFKRNPNLQDKVNIICLEVCELLKTKLDDQEKRIKALEDKQLEHSGIILIQRQKLKALEERDEVKLEAIWNTPVLFEGKPDILSKDPIELFKEDRQSILTVRAINSMRYGGIKTVEQLIRFTPTGLRTHVRAHACEVGFKTIAYVDHCLRRHGLSLRGES